MNQPAFRALAAAVGGLSAFLLGGPAAQASTTAIVVVKLAAVHDAPSQTAPVVAAMIHGMKLSVDAQSGGYEHFTNPSVRGWILARFIKFNPGSGQPPPAKPRAVLHTVVAPAPIVLATPAAAPPPGAGVNTDVHHGDPHITPDQQSGSSPSAP